MEAAEYRSIVATCDIQSRMAPGLIGDDAGVGTEFDGGKRSIELRMYSRINRQRHRFERCRRSRTSSERAPARGNIGKLAKL